MPDPQASDFIYLSIKQELANSESELATKTTQLNELVSKLPETDSQKSDIKLLRAKIDVAKRDLRKLEQKIKYWKVKLLSREEIVRIRYMSAFNQGKEWDSTEETERFKKSIARIQKRAPTNAKTQTQQAKSPEQHNPEE